MLDYILMLYFGCACPASFSLMQVYVYMSHINLTFRTKAKQLSSIDHFRYWALAVPAYLMVTVVLAIGFYIGLNFMATPPPTSFSTMFGKYDLSLSMLLQVLTGSSWNS